MGYTTKKLQDVLIDMHSGGTPSTEMPEYWNGDLKWLSSGETSQRFIKDTRDTITPLGVKESSTKLAHKYNVVMASAGQGKTRGQVSYLLDDMYVNQSVIVMEPDEKQLLPLYLFYNLSDRYEELRGGSDASSTRGSITTTALKRLSISFPDIGTQRRITDLLYRYDCLINTNNEKIQIIENLRDELYKEWFVRMRFPGWEHAKFVDGIPTNWTIDRVGAFYFTCSGGTPSRKKPEYFIKGTYPWVKTGEINDSILIDAEEWITEDAINNSSAKVLPEKTVVMAMYGVNIGQLAYFDRAMTCNQACCVFKDKRAFSSKHYLFSYMKSIRDYLLLIGFGAAQQNLSQDLIKRVKMVMPSDDIVIWYEEIVDHYYDELKVLIEMNQNLVKQRDYLVPRLIRGELII